MSLETGKPYIGKFIEVPDGYTTSDLVLVDGYQGQITIEINTHTFTRSGAAIAIWNPTRMEWTQVFQMEGTEIGRMPLSVHKEEALAALRGIAGHLWSCAEVIVSTSRLRQEDLDVDQAEHLESARLDARRRDEWLSEGIDECTLGDDATALVNEDLSEEERDAQLVAWEEDLKQQTAEEQDLKATIAKADQE